MAASAHAGRSVEAELRASGVAAREVAGFVGSITTCVCYALFLLWAFVPEEALRAAGVTYYPAKWWALAAPSWLCAAVLYCYTAYGSLNLMAVVSPESLRAVTDPAAVVLQASVPGGAEQAAPVASELPLSHVCALLYAGGESAACTPRGQAAASEGQGAAAPVPRKRGQRR